MHTFRSSGAFPASSSMAAWSSPEPSRYTQWPSFPRFCGCLTWLSVPVHTTQEELWASTALQVRNCCCLGFSSVLPSSPTTHFQSCWSSHRQGRKYVRQMERWAHLFLCLQSVTQLPKDVSLDLKKPTFPPQCLRTLCIRQCPQLLTSPCISFSDFSSSISRLFITCLNSSYLALMSAFC